MKWHPPKRHQNTSGFTLLEVVIALGLLSLMIGMIFRMAQTSMLLSKTVVEKQSEVMERNAFFQMLKNHFEQMPGNAEIRLESFEATAHRKLFTMTFQNVPMAFSWGDSPMTAEALELTTIERRNGFIDVVLRFYDQKILDDSQGVADDDVKPFAEIILLQNLWICECEVVDGRSMEQTIDWETKGRLPLLVKFYCAFDPVSEIIEQTFWIVPKQNPEVYMRQIIQKNPTGHQPGEGTGEGEGNGTPPVNRPPVIEHQPAVKINRSHGGNPFSPQPKR